MISSRWMVGVLLIAGCDAAEGVRVQPLPPLERSSPEARAGLPELEGTWLFTGWELTPADSAGLTESYPQLGQITVEVQRLDSIAGAYRFEGGGSLRLYGEVRRDGIVSMVAQQGAEGRIIAGQMERDTLWVRLSTLLEPGSWPNGARAGFVREEPTIQFVRLPGQTVTVALADTAVADTAAPADSAGLPMLAGPAGPLLGFGGLPTQMLAAFDSAAPTAPTPPAARRPGPLLGFGGFPRRPAIARTEPVPTRPAGPRVLGTPTTAEPAARTEREPVQAQPEPAEPPSEEPPAPAAPTPRLLGVPVDTTGVR